MSPRFTTFCLLLFTLLATDAALAQLWVRTIDLGGNETINCIRRTFEGNYILAGTTQSPNDSSRGFLLCVNPNGDTLWSRKYRCPRSCHLNSVVQTPDSGFIAVGTVADTSGFIWNGQPLRLWIVRTNRTGDTLWTKHKKCYLTSERIQNAGYFSAEDIVAYRNGYVICGSLDISIIDGPPSLAYVYRITETGDSLWEKTLRDAYNWVYYGSSAYSICLTTHNDLAVGGNIDNFSFPGFTWDDNAFLALIDSSGNTTACTEYSRWRRAQAPFPLEYGNGTISCSDSTYLAYGFYRDTSGVCRGWLIGTDRSGTEQWNYIYGSHLREEINAVIEVSDGYVFTGVDSLPWNRDVWIGKVNRQGTLLWSHTCGTARSDAGVGIVRMADGGFLIAAQTYNAAGSGDVLLVKLDSLGTTSAPEPLVPTLPNTFGLLTAYPNPFNATTTIRYSIPQNSDVMVDVVNVMGSTVTTLYRGARGAGEYAVSFNGENLPSGIYFVRLRSGQHQSMQKVVLLK